MTQAKRNDGMRAVKEKYGTLVFFKAKTKTFAVILRRQINYD